MSRPFADWPEVMSAEDMKDCADLPHKVAYALFARPDFPAINKARRGRKVGKHALRAYLNRGVQINED